VKRLAFGLALVAPLVLGCAQDEGSDEPIGPPKVEFTGKVDPELAGVWRSREGDSVLTLDKDGSLKIDSTFKTPVGMRSATKRGNWLADAERLRLRYKEDNGEETTIAYPMKTSGNTMTLSTKVPKKDTVYTRK